MATQECTVRDVRELLDHSRSRYQNLVKRLKNDLQSIAVTPSLRHRISRIYSRSDTGSDELKNAWKICAKVNAIRYGGTDAAGLQRKAKPDFAIRDLWDIVGLTVVCVFPSDLLEVRDFISRMIEDKKYKEKEDRLLGALLKLPGYSGIHFALQPTEEQYRDIWCEVQIKTVSSDAWTLKTHDLTYKPRGEIGYVFRRQMEIIGELLQQIDQQSEIIKNEIQRSWQKDTRRYAVCYVHGEYLRKNRSDPELLGMIDRVYSSIENDVEIKDDELSQCLRVVDELRKQEDLEGVARAKMMLAITAEAFTADEVSYAIQQWRLAATDNEAVIRAFLLQSIVHFIYGNLEAGIEALQPNLERSESLTPNLLARTYHNLAYFYTDSIHSKLGRDINATSKAGEYLRLGDETVQRIKDDSSGDSSRMRSRIQDAQGYFEIVTGRTETAIRAGLGRCYKAYSNSPEKESAKRYYDVHERIAWQRILNLDSMPSTFGIVEIARMPFDPNLFFMISEDTQMIPLSEIRLGTFRPDGVARGNQLMREVLNRIRIEKREPITVEKEAGGTYSIVDGHSTFVNACFSLWPSIPAKVINA